jgi:hypothetical protein
MSSDIAATLPLVLSAFGMGGLVAVAVAALILKNYVPAYLSKKGENLATKEDIAAITREVEKVRLEYALIVENTKSEHQLRSAALDDRLRAHQQAFTHWRQLMQAAHNNDDDELRSRIKECQRWWNENCLYLSPESREAFSDSFWAARHLTSHGKATLGPEAQERNWQRAGHAGEVLLKAVQLPTLGSRESSDVTRGDA